MGTFIDKIIKEKADHTPKAGYAVVGVDEFGGDGVKELYTIAQCNTLEEAREARKTAIAEGAAQGNTDEILIFDPQGRSLK